MPRVRAGELALPPAQAHHARDVLRLRPGDVIELFDDTGHCAEGTILDDAGGAVRVRVDQVQPPGERALRLTVASAVPKGPRADWMIEKLSEIGVDRFIPLATARAVVLPEGKNKLERWTRLAAEAARQSRRPGVMAIAALADVGDVVRQFAQADTDDSAPPAACYLSTAPEARPLASLLEAPCPRELMLLIGPEGGWTGEEVAAFDAARLAPLSLTATILRVETAALIAAGAILSLLGRG